MKKIDITGQRFGRLTVLYEEPVRRKKRVYWHCICDCGTKITVESMKLRNGHTKSCGCLKNESLGRKDLTGQRFGRLVVKEMIYERYGTTKCVCQCDCGNQTTVAATSLIHNVTRSCGCLRSETTIKRCSKNLVGQRFGKLTVIERIKVHGKDTQYKCLCDCGNYTIVDGRALPTGGVGSCGCGVISQGEAFIDGYLAKMSIPYLRQYKFSDCKYKKELPFDFYLPEQNVCIEYQGIQHYAKIDFFDGDTDNFETRKLRDNIKRKYCKDNNILLLEIPYYLSKDEIQGILTNKLNP